MLVQPTAGLAKAKRTAPRGQDIETRITSLHKELRITPEQESAWNGVAQAMRENAQRPAERGAPGANRDRYGHSPGVSGSTP